MIVFDAPRSERNVGKTGTARAEVLGPPIDGWESNPPSSQSDGERTQNRVAVVNERTGPLLDAERANSPIHVAENQRRQHQRQEVDSKWSHGDEYPRDSKRDLRRDTRPSKAERRGSTRVYESSQRRRDYNNYTPKQQSKLARINQQHRRRVAKVHRKLFGRRDDRDRSKYHKADRRSYDGSHQQRWRGSNNHNRSTASLVPPGYYPPKGLCRIWYYDVEPHRQPPSDNCEYLRARMPFDARLLIGA